MTKDWYKPGAWNAICSKCSVEKDESGFYQHSNGKLMAHCKKCHGEMGKKYRTKHPNIYTAPKTEEERLKRLTASRKWREANKEYDAHRSTMYRSRRLQRTPVWSDLSKIETIYMKCPKGFHVDHIVPLKGKLVSGLHVPDNLQYLPAVENYRKRNIYHVE